MKTKNRRVMLCITSWAFMRLKIPINVYQLFFSFSFSIGMYAGISKGYF